MIVKLELDEFTISCDHKRIILVEQRIEDEKTGYVLDIEGHSKLYELNESEYDHVMYQQLQGERHER